MYSKSLNTFSYYQTQYCFASVVPADATVVSCRGRAPPAGGWISRGIRRQNGADPQQLHWFPYWSQCKSLFSCGCHSACVLVLLCLSTSLNLSINPPPPGPKAPCHDTSVRGRATPAEWALLSRDGSVRDSSLHLQVRPGGLSVQGRGVWQGAADHGQRVWFLWAGWCTISFQTLKYLRSVCSWCSYAILCCNILEERQL